MKQLVALLLLFFSAAPAPAQTARNARPLTAPASEKWTIRWNRSDDFNGHTVDWRKWNKTPENFRAWTWDNESNISVSNGIATMSVRRVVATHGLPQASKTSRDGSSHFTSAMLKSYATGTYGYYEAMKLMWPTSFQRP